MTQRILPEEDQLSQAFFLDAPDEPLHVEVQVRRPSRQANRLDVFLLEEVPKVLAEPVVSVHQQIA